MISEIFNFAKISLSFSKTKFLWDLIMFRPNVFFETGFIESTLFCKYDIFKTFDNIIDLVKTSLLGTHNLPHTIYHTIYLTQSTSIIYLNL